MQNSQNTTTLDRAGYVRSRSLERFLENQRFEEKTDLSERLGYHISTSIDYEMIGGSAYALTDAKHRPFHEQTLAAYETGRWKFTGNNAFEAERLRLENEEALLVDAFGRGELPGNILIKFSKVPDAVVDGTASVNGYRRDLMRSFVRIYYMTGEKTLSCQIFSLDGNSATGLKNIEPLIGMRLHGTESEKALGQHTLLDWRSDDLSAQIELLKEEIIFRYDEGVLADTGQKTYAGSSFNDRANALQIIEKHPDLFDEHWRAVSGVQTRILSESDREDFLEEIRRKTAAAIKLRESGSSVDSIGDASVATEAESGEYGRECATSGMSQAELSEIGKEINMTCPFCGLSTKGDPCAVILECDKCHARIEYGRVASKGIGRAAARQALKPKTTQSFGAAIEKNTPIKGVEASRELSAIKHLFGEYAILRSRVAFGNSVTDVIDRRTGRSIQQDFSLTA